MNERAAGPYNGGFRFKPLIASCGREILAGILRPGNAGANNAEDQLALLGLALEKLLQEALGRERSWRVPDSVRAVTIPPTRAASATSAFRSPNGSAVSFWKLLEVLDGRRSIRTACPVAGRG